MTKKEEIKKIANELNITQKLAKDVYEKREDRMNRRYTQRPLSIQDRKDRMYFKHVPDLYTGRDEGSFSPEICERNHADMQYLIQFSGWLQYSKRTGWYKEVSYLVGMDKDSREWYCIQVPGRITSLKDALDWIKPAAVKKAEKEGKKILRQGDVYFVEMKNSRTIGNVPESHRIEKTDTGYKVFHEQHGELVLDGNWKGYVQKSVQGRVTD